MNSKLAQLQKNIEKLKTQGQSIQRHGFEVSVKEPNWDKLITPLSKAIDNLNPKFDQQIKKLSELVNEFKSFYVEVPETVKVSNLREVPTQKEVRVTNLSEIKTEQDPRLDELSSLLKEIKAELKDSKLPKTAKEAISVRLSDGEKFYKALENYIVHSSGGGSSYAFDKQDSSPTKAATVQTSIGGKTRDAIVVVNPDGTAIAGGGGSGGTEYEDGEAVATPSGTVVMGHDGSNARAFTVDSDGDQQVDIKGALPAGTNAIGKLSANSGVDIGDVDVTSIAAGDNNIGNVDVVTVPTDPFGANADAASATGSISAKLRFIASTGIPVTGTVAVTQSGTWDEVGINDSGNVITVDGSGSAGSAATGVQTIQGIASMTPVQVGDNSSSLSVDWNGTQPVTGSGTATGALRVELPTNGTGVIATVGAVTSITNAVTVNSHAVTNAGTFAVQDATAQASLSVMDDWDNAASDGASVSGDVAHDSGDAGEPVKLGFKAVALKTNPTEVAANDRSNWYGDVSGIPFVLGGHMNTLTQNLQVTDADGAQTDAAIITAGANVAIVVTSYEVVADHANTGDVSVRIGFGTANTPAADAAQCLMFHPGIAPGSGVSRGNGGGILGIGASNEDLRVTCEDPAGGSISIIITYFTTDI